MSLLRCEATSLNWLTATSGPSRAARLLLWALAPLVVLAGPLSGGTTPSTFAQDEPAPEASDVIVVLEEGADPAAVAADLGVEPTHIYEDVITGFSAPMTESELMAARGDDQVQEITPDGLVHAEAQAVSTGVTRVGLPLQPGTHHMALPSPIDADIAILDTGANGRGDLNVAGGKSCVAPKPAPQPNTNNKKKKHKERPAAGDKKGRKGHGDKQNRKGHGDKKNGKGHGDKKNEKKHGEKRHFAARSALGSLDASSEHQSTNKQGAQGKKHGKARGKQRGDNARSAPKHRKRVNAPAPRSGSESVPWADDNGHGTHVAGIAAAIDNDQGVLGVAPGARIWAVKVLDESGSGTFADVICGLDWVVANQATIDVVNLSLSGVGSDGPCFSSALHNAICNVVNAGIPVVVAAGNQGTNAANRVPASFDEVITVGGFSDSDGAPGGLGGPSCFGADDTYLGFSNFGPDVDLAAPGDCILSIDPGGGTSRESGTSEASPHVAGALARFVASFVAAHGTRPTPAESRDWLLNEATASQDGLPYPVLWLADALTP